MADAMVTARMAPAKKELVARKLEELGTNPSQFINRCYDYVLEHGELPIPNDAAPREHTSEELVAAQEWMRTLLSFNREPGSFDNMSLKEVKRERLIAKGLMEADDCR